MFKNFAKSQVKFVERDEEKPRTDNGPENALDPWALVMLATFAAKFSSLTASSSAANKVNPARRDYFGT